MFSFSDQVVVVTGAGQGIGAEVAKEFAQADEKVVIIDFNGETAEATAQEIKAMVAKLLLIKWMSPIINELKKLLQMLLKNGAKWTY